MHQFDLGGLTIASDVVLPLAPSTNRSRGAWDLRVEVSDAVSDSLGMADRLPWCFEPGLATCWVRGVATFDVYAATRRIVVHPVPGAAGADVALFLLRILPVAAAYQGHFFLDAAAVSSEPGATVCLGGPGAGKSTWAARFLARDPDALLLADSLTRVSCEPGGRLMVWPGEPWLHLWPDAIAAVGGELGLGEPVRAAGGLRRVPQRRGTPTALSRVVLATRDHQSRPAESGAWWSVFAGATFGRTVIAGERILRVQHFQWLDALVRAATIKQ